MESPEERLMKQRKEAQEKAKLEQRESSTILPSEGDSDELGGFDLDSVLASAGKPSSTPGPGSQKQAKKSTSAVTAEMTSVGSSSEQKTTEPAAQPKQSRGPPPSMRNTSSESQASAPVETQQPEPNRKPPVRRRKAVRKAASSESEPSSRPERKSPPQRSLDDEDDDFSDFSF